MRETTDFVFKRPPMAHQLACFERSRDLEYFALFIDMGGGKTKVILDTASWLWGQGRVTGLLVVAPKSITRNWLDVEAPQDIPDHVRWIGATYDTGGNKASRDAVEALFADRSGALRILAVNIESMSLSKEGKTSKGFDLCERFLLSNQALMAIDESTIIKHESAQRTKACLKLARMASYRRIATGDPYANSPLDIFAQAEFLSPDALGFGSYWSFKNHFAEVVPMSVRNPKTNKDRKIYTIKTDRDGRKVYKNVDELKRIVERFSFTIKKEDCLDLPPKVYLAPRRVEMTANQKRVYEEMRKAGLAEIEERQASLFDEKSARGSSITEANGAAGFAASSPANTAIADIVLTKLMRLQQIACGFVVNAEGDEIDLVDGSNPRVAGVVDALSQIGGKAIIWANFRRSIDELVAAISAEYGPRSVVRCDGSTTPDELEEAKRRFQDPLDPCRWFVGNQAKGGRGLTLTAAELVLYFSNSFDGELRVQSEDRAHRIGQTKSVAYQDVRSAPIDDKVAGALDGKKSVSSILRDGSWKRFFD